MKTIITMYLIFNSFWFYQNTNQSCLKELQYKTPKHIISDIVYKKPEFKISQSDMEKQKKKHEDKMNELFNLAQKK